MISLVVISVIAAVLYPTIAQFTPNSNKPLFKAAYSTLSSVLFEITNSIPSGKLVNYSIADDGTVTATDQDLCEEFCGVANVLPEKKSDDSFITDCAGLCTDNIITTSNGMRWKFGDTSKIFFGTYNDPKTPAVTHDNVYRIIVDVNAANNDLSPTVEIADINLSTNASDYKGVFYLIKERGNNNVRFKFN